MNTETVNQTQNAAAWLLKNLSTNRNWFDEIRHAGYDNFERDYHYIPLFDLCQLSPKYDIATLKDACYMLKQNNHVDIWGDDFEPYGMLVQISPSGLNACEESFYVQKEKSKSKRAIGVFATLTLIIALAIGINKTFVHKQDKSQVHDTSKAKTTAFLNSGDNQ
jgi:3',5'-cyclic AMP phosphodiesterase CpdA